MNRNVLVGLFVLSALVLLALGLFLIGDTSQAFAKHVDYYANFVNLSGLQNGAKVQVSGMDAGKVVEIVVPPSPSGRFHVKVRIDSKLSGLIRTDSLASVTTQGVVGDTILAIRSGTDKAPEAKPLATLPSKEAFDLSAMLEHSSVLLDNVNHTVTNVNNTVTALTPRLTGVLDQANTTIGNLDDIVVGIKHGRGAVGMLLEDQQFAGQVRQTVGTVQAASTSINHASGQADALISDLNRRELPQKIDDTMGHVNRAASNIDATSQQLRTTMDEIAGPDRQGIDTGQNIRESLANLNAATANLNDDTEALKRNFFFKAYFRHRGFYSLSEMSPETYRDDKTFKRPGNARIWLQASQLFVTGSNGTEQLSREGRQALDQAMASAGEAATASPIVVEGYSDAGALAEQVASSRHRSILVRGYLLDHFRLNASNIGAVALQGKAPEGIQRPAEGAVCIVVVRKQK